MVPKAVALLLACMLAASRASVIRSKTLSDQDSDVYYLEDLEEAQDINEADQFYSEDFDLPFWFEVYTASNGKPSQVYDPYQTYGMIEGEDDFFLEPDDLIYLLEESEESESILLEEPLIESNDTN